MLILRLTITSLHPLSKFIYLGALSTHHCLIARLLLPQLLLHLLHYLKHVLIWLRPQGWQLIINIHSIHVSVSCFLSQFLTILVSCWCCHLSFSWWHYAYFRRSITTRHGLIIWSIHVFNLLYSIWVRSTRHGSIIWFSLLGHVC